MDSGIGLLLLERTNPTIQDRLRHDSMIDEFVSNKYKLGVLDSAADRIDKLEALIRALEHNQDFDIEAALASLRAEVEEGK